MEIDFEKGSQELLDIFKLNLTKAIMIAEVEKNSLNSQALGDIAKEIEELDKALGIENIARNQAIVMLITSFEAYVRDFFMLMVTREDILKRTLRNCEQLKAKSKDLLDLIRNKSSWGILITEKENLSFQSIYGLNKVFKMMGQEFEDILEEALKDTNNLLSNDQDTFRKIVLSGEEVIEKALSIRHQVVHEGKVFTIEEVDFDNYVLFFRFLGAIIRNKFFETKVQYIYKRFSQE